MSGLRNPVLGLRSHLLWTRSGVPWAVWRLDGLAYGHARPQDKETVRARHQALFQSLHGEWMLLGLTCPVDVAQIGQAMIEDIDLDTHPEWATEVQMTLAELDHSHPQTRVYYLAAPLSAEGWQHRLAHRAHALEAQGRTWLGLRSPIPAWTQFEVLERAAGVVEQQIPRAFRPRPASRDDLLWITDHAAQRGLGCDAALPALDTDPGPGPWHCGAGLGEPWLDEGAATDHPGPAHRASAFTRRYVKVGHPSGTISYQSLLVMTGTPRGGFSFPGGEFLAVLEQLPVDADFCVRLTVSAAAKAKRRNRRVETTLNDQYDQQETENVITGGGGDLDISAAELAAFTTALNRSDVEVEVQATTIVAVGAATPEVTTAKAHYIRDHFKDAEWVFTPVLGEQSPLWWSMIPGTPLVPVVTELAQLSTGGDFSMAVPLVSSELGDSTGFRVADNISSGRRAPVLMNPAGNALLDISGSMAVLGEKGSGKSTFLKTVVSHCFDRGELVVMIDRSDNTEWAHFARALVPERSTILDLSAPAFSLDPLRLFDGAEGAQMVQSLFAVLLSVQALSLQGAVLSQMLEHDYTRHHGIDSLQALLEHLRALDALSLEPAQRQAAAELSGRMRVFATTKLGRVLFDRALPVLPLDSQAIVFCTHGLSLPRPGELTTPELKAEMRLETIFGRAMYSLLVFIGRQLCFADDTQPANFVVDEAHHATGASPEAAHEFADFLRYDRKHMAAVLFGSHVAVPDLGPEELTELIPQRLVFRHRDENAAAKNLRWFAHYDQPEWIEEVTRNLSPIIGEDVPAERRGEGFYRDARNRIGKIQVRLPNHPARRAAVLSTPGTITRAATAP